MRGVVWLLLIFAVAVIAASTFGNNDGLVSIYWHPWRVDLSFNLFVLLMLVASIVLYALVQAVNALVGLPRRAHEWRLLQRERIAQLARHRCEVRRQLASAARTARGRRRLGLRRVRLLVLVGNRYGAEQIALIVIHRLSSQRSLPLASSL